MDQGSEDRPSDSSKPKLSWYERWRQGLKGGPAKTTREKLEEAYEAEKREGSLGVVHSKQDSGSNIPNLKNSTINDYDPKLYPEAYQDKDIKPGKVVRETIYSDQPVIIGNQQQERPTEVIPPKPPPPPPPPPTPSSLSPNESNTQKTKLPFVSNSTDHQRRDRRPPRPTNTTSNLDR